MNVMLDARMVAASVHRCGDGTLHYAPALPASAGLHCFLRRHVSVGLTQVYNAPGPMMLQTRTLALVLALYAPRAFADQTLNAKPIFSGVARYPAASPLATLRYAASHDDDRGRQEIARGVLNALTKYNPSLILDFGSRYYRVVFLASQPNGDTVLTQTLVHEPMPAGNLLEGLHGPAQPLLTLFLADNASAHIHTAATVTQEANPLAADLASLVTTTLTKAVLPAAIAHTLTVPPPLACDDCVPLSVTLSTLELPFARGRVSIADTITFDDQPGYVATRMQMLAADATQDASTAACVKTGILALAAVPDSAPIKSACTPATTLDASNACSTALKAAFGNEFARLEPCTGPALRAAAMRMLDAIADIKATVAKTEFANVPRTHVTVGLAAAFLFAAQQSAPRVSMQSGQIALNPLARPISLAIVNWFPRGFNSKEPHLTNGERYRLFGGVALTPSFGPAAGGAIALSQNLAVNVGAALMLTDVAKSGETIGAAPIDASPFKIGVALGWFAGFSYNLK
jgi:hypothetical protein